MPAFRSSSRAPHPLWAYANGRVRILFVGRGPGSERRAVLGSVSDQPPAEVSWARQVHGAEVLAAVPGCAGAGDALVTRESSRALAISTADCVPVVLVGRRGVAAVHAGWRGLDAGVLGRTTERLEGPLEAWIGPAIGPCCYEVGTDVAERVVAASDPSILRQGPGAKPRLDLRRAAALQLREQGVTLSGGVAICTRCHGDLFFSYRREGRGTGRNLSFVWLE